MTGTLLSLGIWAGSAVLVLGLHKFTNLFADPKEKP